MGTRLALTCRLETRETPTSFLSRLAARNGISAASDFSLDIGIDWKNLRLGKLSTIAELARLSGADKKALQQYTFSVQGPACWTVNGEFASNKVAARTRVPCCPHCALEAFNKHGFAGVFSRADWHFLSVRCCEIHHVPIMRLPPPKYAVDSYDTVSLMREHWAMIEAAAHAPTTRQPTRLEHYLRKRISGWNDNSWLHRWRLPIALRASELLGVRLLFGAKARTTQMSEDQLHLAAEAGFDVLNGGKEVLREKLLAFHSENTIGFGTHHSDMGVFFAWLTREFKDNGIDELRAFVREFIEDIANPV